MTDPAGRQPVAVEPVRAPVPATPDRAPSAQTDAPQPTTDTGTLASAFGELPDHAGFVAKLGPGFRLGAEFLTGHEVPIGNLPQPLPGVSFRTARFREHQLTLTGGLTVPHLSGDFQVRVARDGKPRIHGSVHKQLALPALGNPSLTLTLSEEGVFGGSVTVQGIDLLPPSLRRRGVTATGSGLLILNQGLLSGTGHIAIVYDHLGSGAVNFRFTDQGQFAASGTINITPPLLNQLTANLAVDEAGNLTADVAIAIGDVRTSVPGLTVTGGTIQIGYRNGAPSASIQTFAATYAGLGSINIANASVNPQGHLAGAGTFAFEIPGLDVASGNIAVRDGRLSGSVTLGADKFPRGLPVRRPSITATYNDGQFGVAGSATVDLGPAGTGTFHADWSTEGVFSFGGQVRLTVPGLNESQVTVGYANGAISGEANIPVNTQLLPGLDGSVTVRYAEDRWSGETTLSYAADNGKLSGEITVTVAQDEQNHLQIGGSGQVTAQIAPRLQGTLTATILPEGAVDVSGAIEVTEPLELFPEKRLERELFSHSQNIPLWGILVAVIRVKAGVRAGIGAGVFRNIRVEGSYTIGAAESDPSFSITGEMFIPAFVEGYVSFGAGLGLDVVLGSLTGGIEGVATAGLYGAISVVPELSYENGDWGIEGTATLAAGARLKLGLNAWAEVEALWITVWENTWKLAEFVMPIGPDLALQAQMSYKFGNPAPPEIEFNTSDIDTDSLIQSAMPKDDPPTAGAREALDNKAEWKGALKEQREAAAIPPAVAAEANKTEHPPEPPARKPKSGPPPGVAAPGQAGTAPDAAHPDAAGAAAPGSPATPGAPAAGAGAPAGAAGAPASGAPAPPPTLPGQAPAVAQAAAADTSIPPKVPEGALPGSDLPRYPGPITLETLNEPPAPLPRTPQQEQQDLDAAARAVDLARIQASDTDQLDNYFPQIKNRFRLTSLGYEGDFSRGFEIVGKINPDFKIKPHEPLRGTGIPGDVQNSGHISNIVFKSQDLGGKGEVGVEMEASPLGPDHPQGSGPSGQDALMNALPTDPSLLADQKYIRGHLLNDNLGGPGTAMNLFPITGQANARHHSSVEASVKEWVNDRRYWVKYKVKISNIGALTPRRGGLNSVDATIDAEASVLDTDLKAVSGLTRRVSINSTYKVGDAETVIEHQVESATAVDAHQARSQDLAVDPLLSSRHEDRTFTFPAKMYNDLKAAQGRGRPIEKVAQKLIGPGFGEASAALLAEAWRDAGGPGNPIALGTRQATFTSIANMWDSDLLARLS